MPSRDPRVDPRPGDVVIYGPQWQRERGEVVEFDRGWVKYRISGGALDCHISAWRCLMAGAEVIHTAEATPGTPAALGEEGK